MGLRHLRCVAIVLAGLLLGSPAGAGPDIFDALLGNPVIKAADSGDTAKLKKRLDKGASVETKDKQGRTLLHISVSKGRFRTVQLLLSRKADVNAVDSYFKTPLMYACERGYTEIALALLEAGAEVNVRTPDDAAAAFRRFTPLMFAAQTGQLLIVKELLKRGADVTAVDNNDKTALAHAERSGNIKIARLLEEAVAERDFAVGGSTSTAGGLNAAKIEQVVAQAVLKAQERQKPSQAAEIVSDVDEPKYRLKEDPRKFALVIGIERYSNVPDAQFAERDATAVAAHLEAMGYPRRNIVSLVGEKATKTGFVKMLQTWLPRNAVDASTVFFYYSGHGSPDTKTGDAYLVPWDGDPLYLKDTAYPLRRVYAELEALKAQRVIVSMDACFSGAGGRSVLAKGIRPLVTKVDTSSSIPGEIIAFSASQADQISGALDEQGHGAFTYYFLKGLNGEAVDKNGEVTVGSLYDYLSPKVQDAARRQNREQAPQLVQPRGADAEVLRRSSGP